MNDRTPPACGPCRRIGSLAGPIAIVGGVVMAIDGQAAVGAAVLCAGGLALLATWWRP